MLVANINKALEDDGAVMRGRDIRYMKWERIPTGSLGLDIITGGGLPLSTLIQYKGQESCGKTSMAMQACALTQERGKHVAWSAVEGFDKEWARYNRCYIPYSDEELELFVQDGEFSALSEAREYSVQYDEEHAGYGDFVLSQAKSGPRLLQVTCKVVRSGLFELAVVDSLGAIISEEDDDKEVGQETRVGGNAKPITHFVNKVCSSFNGKADGDPEAKTRVRTAVVAINQVRDQIGAYSPKGKPEPEAGGGYALRHGKSIDIRFRRGELYRASIRGRKIMYGREVKAVCEKNKTAPPHMDAAWDYFVRDVPSLQIRGGAVFLAKEVVAHGAYYGVIPAKGAWIYLGDKKFQGVLPATEYLSQRPDEVEHFRKEILEVACRVA